jgi:oligoribonuclease
VAQDPNNLIWIDMEMSGLLPDSDRILELAILITDPNLQVIAESDSLVVHQPDEVLAAMDAWNQGVHGKTGLIERVRTSDLDEAEVERRALAFVAQHVPTATSPMCGSSIGQDRRFLARWMPRLEGYFHYRNLDVSTLKELVRRWRPDLAKGFVKQGRHEALADIRESIEELRYYRRSAMSI